METKNADILSCWKEIAEYMDRSVRTCQRWAKKKDLPVSYPGGKNSSPYASKIQLDGWRLKNRAVQETARPSSPLNCN